MSQGNATILCIMRKVGNSYKYMQFNSFENIYLFLKEEGFQT